MQAVFNTQETHNLVVCTLCSCYPWTVLGLPPVWYKSPPYRTRAVIDPRSVLAEFGLTLPKETKIRVWQSTAELRYLVVPMRRKERRTMDRRAGRARHPRFHDRDRRWRRSRHERAAGCRRAMGFGPIAPEKTSRPSTPTGKSAPWA